MFRLLSKGCSETWSSSLLRRRITPDSWHVPIHSGPPNYQTITRRLYSQPDPVAYFSEKRQQGALERGEFTDIHDISPQRMTSILFTGISHETLEHRISEELGIVYLLEARCVMVTSTAVTKEQ